jgi:hypothetical protein
VIVEDHGPIGIGGRRLFRIEVFADPDEPIPFLVPADELEPEDNLDQQRKLLEKSRIIDYLKQGGLVAILQSNSSGGRSQPRVWLCLDNLGNVTHTFAAERGLIGGATVPFWTLYENNKIFSAKQEEVIAFLGAFGLNRAEAEDIIQTVGIAP